EAGALRGRRQRLERRLLAVRRRSRAGRRRGRWRRRRPRHAGGAGPAMKVHVQGQSLRLRIDEDGLARLLAGGELVNETRAGDAALRQRLRLSEDTSPRLEVEGDDWTFLLPAG